jgi:hypothetical protein
MVLDPATHLSLLSLTCANHALTFVPLIGINNFFDQGMANNIGLREVAEGNSFNVL